MGTTWTVQAKNTYQQFSNSENINDLFNGATAVKSLSSNLISILTALFNGGFSAAIGKIDDTVGDLIGTLTTYSLVFNNYNELDINDDNEISGIENAINKINNISLISGNISSNLAQSALNASEGLAELINQFTSNVDSSNTFISVITKALDAFSNGALKVYQDGVSETSFGYLMENSWSKTSKSFLGTFSKNNSSYTVKINKSTPLDSGENMNNIFGNMLLGVPPISTHITDPRNRTMTNSFLSDAKFLLLTPGYPKFNGSYYTSSNNDDAFSQTKTGESMLEYLLKNGIDESFANKDRRYYTFTANYEDYYAYLETMINTIWIKMGLGTEDASTFNIYSFFNLTDENGNINPNNASSLMNRYKSAIGFYVNPQGILTESINNSTTGFGSSLADDVNSASNDFQRINYLAGMGTGGTFRNTSSLMVKAGQVMTQAKDFLSEMASNTISGLTDKSKSLASRLLSPIYNIPKDTINFYSNKDMGQVMQTFSTTNGMKVVYPELWSDSSFSKTVNINFEFISPYGDPMSIFQYVMVPFACLLCFAMPRQADENGFVSPFFIRADIPGLFTSDFGLITDFTWTRGGNNDLWTKDGLPRAISGSFTIADLYPFLSMTKRFSFLSANPSYTVFLDSLAGLHAVDQAGSDNSLNDYFKQMLNRVTGQTSFNGLWNNYSKTKQGIHQNIANSSKLIKIQGNSKNITWLRGIS